MTSPAHQLVFHAAVVLMFGLLLGIPYGRAINRSAPAQITNSWRVAHQSLPIAATLMFAIAALLDTFAVEPAFRWLIAVTLIGSSYSFCVSMPLAAITGHRGLARGGTGLQRLVLLGNVAGAWLSAASGIALLYAAAVSI